MATLPDLRTFYDPHLHLPIDGTTYTVNAPGAELGRRIEQYFRDPATILSDEEQIAVTAELFGATHDPETGTFTGGVWSKLVDDGISWPEIMRAGVTALIHYGRSEHSAAVYWRAGDAAIEGMTLPPEPTKKAPAKKAAPRKRAAKAKA